MSEEMKSIEGLRSSDVFDLTAVGFPSFWSDEQVRVCSRAIRNYDEMKDKADRLTEENRKLRELVEMVESASSADNDVKAIMIHSFIHSAKQLLEELK